MEIIRGVIPCAKKVVIYGPEGIGKSTFASKFPDPVFIDTEGSTNSMDVARLPKASSWQMLLDQVDYVRSHPTMCKTLVIDTIDWAESMCIRHICDKHRKSGIEDFGYGNGYVYVKEELGKLLNQLTEVVEAGVNVVLTLHVRGKIVDALNSTLPELFKTILQCDDIMNGNNPGEYEISVKFGEYASPDFGTTVETVGKAKQYGVMSLETSVDQLYGDTWTDEEKEAEVERLKLEQGVQDLEEPGLTMKAGEFETSLEEGENDEGKSRTTDLQDEPKGVPGVSGSSKRAGTDGRVRSEKE